MADVFVYDAVRTPFGRYGGALAGVRPDDLAALVVRALVRRSPDLDPARVDEIVFGCANGAGEDNRNVGRMAGLLAKARVRAGDDGEPAVRASLDATINGARQVALDDAALVLVGGVESMTRAPWALPKPDRAFPAGNATLVSTALGWRLVNHAMPAEWTVSLGEATEQLREKHGVTREDQDEFALRSHESAAAAWAAGFYDEQVVSVPGVDLARDESIRSDTSLQKLAALQPTFRHDGTVTAGNSSPLSDRPPRCSAAPRPGSSWTRAGRAGRCLGSGGQRAADVWLRARRSGEHGAEARGHRLVRHHGRRAQRGVRRAVARLHPGLGRRPRHRQPARRRDRHRSSAGGVGHPNPRHAGPDLARSGGRWVWRQSASGSGRASPSCWRT